MPSINTLDNYLNLKQKHFTKVNNNLELSFTKFVKVSKVTNLGLKQAQKAILFNKDNYEENCTEYYT